MRSVYSRAGALVALLAVFAVIAACAIGPSSSSGTKTPTANGSATASATADTNGTPTAAPVIPTATTPPGVPTATPIPCPRSDTPFGSLIHTASSRNSAGDYTIITDSALYCQPNAILRVTPNWNPSGGVGIYNNHPIGVWYIGGSTQRWAIFNQDFAAIPNGAAFNVDYGFAIGGATLCVHTATAATISGNTTKIGCETGSDNPNTIMIATPNWNSPGSGVYNNHPIGVYHGGNSWYVFNEDLAAMPVNTTFNLARVNGFVQTATAGNITGDYTTINLAALNGHPGLKLQVTQNWNPGAGSGVYNKHNIGVFYIAGSIQRWAIFNQDLAAMTPGASFNVTYS
jgi:hypothetical protein